MKKLLTEADIVKFSKEGNKILPIGNEDILTPSAIDRAKQLGITIIDKDKAGEIYPLESGIPKTIKRNKVALGCDHTGFRIKNIIAEFLTAKEFSIIDVGTFDEKSCDYPDFAFAVAKNVIQMSADFGIIIDATGIPSAITANKVTGIRAATCYNEFSARSAREHNNANILVIGAKTLGEETIKSILEVWLATDFGGGRHQKRLNKIAAIEENKFR